ncbi:hypothetical protein [Roseobacter litoralis]|uniref:hypothetical protein n=1 Tax=Roseobacter litoralis TaxID=42443 RepID=UPI002490CCCB|nr:hypothetical protein [Roseobacter litoralis]
MESDICLATSVIARRAGVLDLRDAFHAAFTAIGLSLFVEEIGGVQQLLMEGRADAIFEPLEATVVSVLDVIAMARPDHTLAVMERPLSEVGMTDHRHRVPTGRALETDGAATQHNSTSSFYKSDYLAVF